VSRDAMMQTSFTWTPTVALKRKTLKNIQLQNCHFKNDNCDALQLESVYRASHSRR